MSNKQNSHQSLRNISKDTNLTTELTLLAPPIWQEENSSFEDSLHRQLCGYD